MKTSITSSLCAIVLLACVSVAMATPVLTGGTYSQNFNGMGTGTTFPDGWAGYAISGSHDQFKPADDPSGTGALPTGNDIKGGSSVTITAATPASQKAAVAYNWAVGGSTAERSLGTSPTGNAGMVLELTLTNNTGTAVNLVNIDYDVRVFSTTTNNNNYANAPYVGIEELPGYRLFYSLDNGATYSNVTQLNADGKTWANAVGTVHEGVASYALSGARGAGNNIRLRWFDDNAQGPSPDQLIGLDNVVVAAVPEPATMGLLALGGLGVIARRNRK